MVSDAAVSGWVDGQQKLNSSGGEDVFDFPTFCDFLLWVSERVYAFAEAKRRRMRVDRLLSHLKRLEFEVLTYDYKKKKSEE